MAYNVETYGSSKLSPLAFTLREIQNHLRMLNRGDI